MSNPNDVVKELLKRETNGINHTYEVKITLGNVSPRQLDALILIADILEFDNEVKVKKFQHEND